MDAEHDLRPVESSQGAVKLVEQVDRFFFLVWIAIYALLPTSGWASIMFASWFDQKRDLAALRSVIDSGRADAIAHNGIGPAYIAAARLIHEAVRLSPEDSLVLLTRVSYVLAVALGVVLVRVLLRHLIGAPPMVTIGAQFAFIGLMFAAGTWHWSDVPWSHFFAAFLAVAVYALRYAPARLTVLSAAGAGVALALLSLTRSFEFGALVLAWGIVFGGLAVLRLTGARTRAGRTRGRRSGRLRGDNGGRLRTDGQARVVPPLRREPRHAGRERRVRGGCADSDLQLVARADEARAALR